MTLSTHKKSLAEMQEDWKAHRLFIKELDRYPLIKAAAIDYLNFCLTLK